VADGFVLGGFKLDQLLHHVARAALKKWDPQGGVPGCLQAWVAGPCGSSALSAAPMQGGQLPEEPWASIEMCTGSAETKQRRRCPLYSPVTMGAAGAHLPFIQGLTSPPACAGQTDTSTSSCCPYLETRRGLTPADPAPYAAHHTNAAAAAAAAGAV